MVVLTVLYLLYTQVEKGHDTLYFIFLNIYFEIPLVSLVLVFYTLSIGLRGCPRSLEATIEYCVFCPFLSLICKQGDATKPELNIYSLVRLRIRRKASQESPKATNCEEFSYTSKLEYIKRKSSAIVTWLRRSIFANLAGIQISIW